MALRIVIIKMRRGLKGKINENSKPYAFICPIKDIEKGDYVVVEVTRKTFRRNRTNDFRVGRVEEIMSWDDATILKYRPNSFVVCKVDCKNFDHRCTQAYQKKHQLWYRYNRVDSTSTFEGVEMNLFDKALDSDGTLHFERIKDYDSKKTSWL